MSNDYKLQIENLCFAYDRDYILEDSDFIIPSRKISAIFGASGTGKTTLLTLFSLLFRELENYRISGKIYFNDSGNIVDILSIRHDFWEIRRKIVYIAQEPNPLDVSIFRNIAFPMKLNGITNKKIIKNTVIESLERVHLYNEVNNRLKDSALELSGGQMQRLCIARALAMKPEIILLDEPTSSLDSENKEKIEDLIIELGQSNTIIVVSHDREQIKRVSDVVFECKGRKVLKID